jgi:hypothetical protein
MRSSTSTLNRLVLSTESTTREQFQVSEISRVRRPMRANKSVQNAVYAYIRAVRALGRTEINTREVAAALSLPVVEVNGALSSLKKRGIRLSNG